MAVHCSLRCLPIARSPLIRSRLGPSSSMVVSCSLRCLPIARSTLIPLESQSYSRRLPAVSHQREEGRGISAEPSMIPSGLGLSVDGRWLMSGPLVKKESKKTKFLGLTVDGRVRMVRSLARRKQKCMGCGNLTIEPLPPLPTPLIPSVPIRPWP